MVVWMSILISPPNDPVGISPHCSTATDDDASWRPRQGYESQQESISPHDDNRREVGMVATGTGTERLRVPHREHARKGLWCHPCREEWRILPSFVCRWWPPAVSIGAPPLNSWRQLAIWIDLLSQHCPWTQGLPRSHAWPTVSTEGSDASASAWKPSLSL